MNIEAIEAQIEALEAQKKEAERQQQLESLHESEQAKIKALEAKMEVLGEKARQIRDLHSELGNLWGELFDLAELIEPEYRAVHGYGLTPLMGDRRLPIREKQNSLRLIRKQLDELFLPSCESDHIKISRYR